MYLLLLVSWTKPPLKSDVPLEFIEYFSGYARLSKLATMAGYKTRAFDICYDVPGKQDYSNHSGRKKRSAFDMNGEAGYLFLPCDQVALFFVCVWVWRCLKPTTCFHTWP